MDRSALHDLHVAAPKSVSARHLREESIHLATVRLRQRVEVRPHVLLAAETVVVAAVQVQHGTLLPSRRLRKPTAFSRWMKGTKRSRWTPSR